MKLDVRYCNHPLDSKHYTTQQLREHYLIPTVFKADEVLLTYSHQDRIIAGGVMPVNETLVLNTCKALAVDFFLQRRELGFINVGGDGFVVLDGVRYSIASKDGMYVGMGTKVVEFGSDNKDNPAKFYVNSSPAHATYPTVHIKFENANPVRCGDASTMNKRTIYQYLHPAVCKTCQLSMGMTVLEEGSGWNTMPCHTHERRMEVYFYFDFPQDQAVFHLMGTADETRHIVLHNEQAVISPSWSIHSGVGTTRYTFIWGMCGENQTYDDMDFVKTAHLK